MEARQIIHNFITILKSIFLTSDGYHKMWQPSIFHKLQLCCESTDYIQILTTNLTDEKLNPIQDFF